MNDDGVLHVWLTAVTTISWDFRIIGAIEKGANGLPQVGDHKARPYMFDILVLLDIQVQVRKDSSCRTPDPFSRVRTFTVRCCTTIRG